MIIGGHFCYVDGEIKSKNKEDRMMTWESLDVDVKALHGGYDRETKETILASKDRLQSIRFTIDLVPGDVAKITIESEDLQTGEKSTMDFAYIEKLHIKFMLPECGKNQWKKYREKHDINNSGT